MAKTASLNIRIDPETKIGVENLFSQFGITVTDAVNIFLHQSLMVGGLPFEMKQPKSLDVPYLLHDIANELLIAKEERRNGYKGRRYSEVAKAMEYIIEEAENEK